MDWDIHRLFQRHAKGISGALRKRGFTVETAADLTQDAFVRIVARPPEERGDGGNPAAYLHRVARNLGINHRRRESLLEMVELDAAAAIADPGPSPERIVYSRQCLTITHMALSELPERTRLAFEMHRLGERTIAEVGAELGISTTRAWSLIREAYRHILARIPIEEED